jgi:hypothetical protein
MDRSDRLRQLEDRIVALERLLSLENEEEQRGGESPAPAVLPRHLYRAFLLRIVDWCSGKRK